MTITTDRLLEGKRILVIEDDFYLASDEKALLEEAITCSGAVRAKGSEVAPAQ